MHCPRLEHFVRINDNGTIGCCGHMVDAEQFKDYASFSNSDWLDRLRTQMSNNTWPEECVRCETTEQHNQTSIRLNSIKRHKILSHFNKDYLQLGGTLDNYCNSACVSCNPNLSTKIGNLKGTVVVNDNWQQYQSLPLERLVEIDINGGEPSISVNYNNMLEDLPPNVRIVRINTNGARRIKQLDKLLQRGIKVIVTVSLDGIGAVHDYVRYPIKWTTLEENLLYYASIDHKLFDLDTWTTVSCLNVQQLPQIKMYCDTNNIKHQYAFLKRPNVMSVEHHNWFTADTPYGTGSDNTQALLGWLEMEESVRPNIERFWT